MTTFKPGDRVSIADGTVKHFDGTRVEVSVDGSTMSNGFAPVCLTLIAPAEPPFGSVVVMRWAENEVEAFRRISDRTWKRAGGTVEWTWAEIIESAEIVSITEPKVSA